ncbi:MAG: RraA family protein [Haloechinothrix sp.]
MAALLDRLALLPVSTLCDADKTLPVVDPTIRAMLPGCRVAGPAHTVVAHDDHLAVLVALELADPGSVLVIDTLGGRRAVCGELFATEARRRGLAGIVVDGFCRDLAGLREVGLPVYARGTTPMSGGTRDPGTTGEDVHVGGVPASAGDLVIGDDDGLVVAPAARLTTIVDAAEEIDRAERALLDGMADGRGLREMTNLGEHLAALAEHRDTALRFTV